MVGSDNLTEYRNELDQISESVMPDSWPGHARIEAYKQSKHMDDKSRNRAVELASGLAERTDASTQLIATKAVEKVEERA